MIGKFEETNRLIGQKHVIWQAKKMITAEEARAIVEKSLVNVAQDRKPVELYEPAKYILGLGGKRIRPVVTLLSCNIFSENIEKAINPAVGLEVFHNYTLVHDDIMDNALLRRGKETIHALWGNNTAILSGDAMSILAYELMLLSPTSVLPSVLNTFTQTALEVCEGQQYDMNFETLDSVKEQDYLEMIKLKTSVLLAACMKIGALIGGASEAEAEKLYQVGLNAGLAFQLQDDILDVYGNQALFGKEIGKDIIANKKTFLLIKAKELANAQQLEVIEKWVQKKDFNPEEKVKAIIAIYDHLKIKEITKAEVENYFALANKYLNEVAVQDDRKAELRKVLDSLKERNY
jgi:geranylgeranyl diphosphate synthase type II